ncbi:hypothetical protein [Acanthamoeba castellanii mimivirus]|uniref:Uncharacterized protein R58 n=5 Tax=Mimivirus TaxID=315393 RepID=YR058_MIMIV|nr:hypothetical protein MIMI_gp0070 [Acanthamoeba polyphaga mimivirus]Q5UPD6.1 RecName: Full=Uncharacterized protein R58 [Acanthamoeba polyphaga mimivirus]AHA45825.1 hypothetical protein HIRU_S919 [Hirudovirus strain Sangsue]AHJ39875.1 hypothetical protein [Samba virus]ALR83572.1 hypothetical protein [Niemeyer virus]AMZ02509.1 hypothetical protein [Mimivirus Bombay]BAV61137.1 hypothetical protein [Acanthamoeba castellanii mimivirus]
MEPEYLSAIKNNDYTKAINELEKISNNDFFGKIRKINYDDLDSLDKFLDLPNIESINDIDVLKKYYQICVQKIKDFETEKDFMFEAIKLIDNKKVSISKILKKLFIICMFITNHIQDKIQECENKLDNKNI